MASIEKRGYRSDARRTQAEETRARILEAARKLFSKHGIDRVTIDKLAQSARVSPPTVYALFKSKAGLLMAMTQGALFSGRFDELTEKADLSKDPEEILRITAKIARGIYDNERRQLGLIRGVSAFSPELAKIEDRFEKIRYDIQEQRLHTMVKAKVLRPGLTTEKARDIMWAFTGRDMYRMLVVERGWDADTYERWLGDTLIRTLTAETN